MNMSNQETLRNTFINPSDEFTPIPFWFWNDRISEEEISRQIQDFQEKGVMGFVIHPRIGIPEDLPYLSEQFMELVRYAVKLGKQYGMKVVLYDEGMYPSGSANGMVVKENPEYASRGLKMIEIPWEEEVQVTVDQAEGDEWVAALAVEKTDEKSIDPDRTKEIEIREGRVISSRPAGGNWSILIFVETYSKGTIRGIHFGEDDGEPHAPPSGDLLNPKAMERFIALTHERYYEVLKEYFGDTVIAMFTDEPGILGRRHKKGLKPWTRGFLQWYLEKGNRLLDLPALWLDAGKRTEEIRRRFQKTVNQRLEETYYKPLSRWCEEHGIALTGHPEHSDEIGFLKHFHIPGQDIVWRWVAPEDGKGVNGVHSTMAKCSSDAARHAGRRRNANECFGCCGPEGNHWAFSMDDMKWYLDWMFVRGVNMLYPHAFYYSIDGEKRYGERPPDVGPNNSWWKYYHQISDYIKRMSWIMTDSINLTEVAVLCREDWLPWKIVKPLYENQIEFNYLEEKLLVSEQCRIDANAVWIENQKYSVIVIEDRELVSKEVEEKLSAFVQSGGTVILYDPTKPYESSMKVERIEACEAIASVVRPYIQNEVRIVPPCKDIRVSHVEKGGNHFFVLTNEGETCFAGEISLPITGKIEQWSPWEGTIEEVAVSALEERRSVVDITLHRRESVILYGDSTSQSTGIEAKKKESVGKKEAFDQKWKIYDPLQKEWKDIKEFHSWTEWEHLQYYAGTLVYEAFLDYNGDNQDRKTELDLGAVHEIAHVYINGKSAGIKMWSPYVFEITEFLQPGKNSIKVEVTNSKANSLSKISLPSGIIGPVQIIRCS